MKALTSEVETEKQRYSELEERKDHLEEQLQEVEDWKNKYDSCTSANKMISFGLRLHVVQALMKWSRYMYICVVQLLMEWLRWGYERSGKEGWVRFFRRSGAVLSRLVNSSYIVVSQVEAVPPNALRSNAFISRGWCVVESSSPTDPVGYSGTRCYRRAYGRVRACVPFRWRPTDDQTLAYLDTEKQNEKIPLRTLPPFKDSFFFTGMVSRKMYNVGGGINLKDTSSA